jgi:hypothetical protein
MELVTGIGKAICKMAGECAAGFFVNLSVMDTQNFSGGSFVLEQ